MLVIFNLLETPPAWGLQVMQQLNIFYPAHPSEI
jgi:hypothetical protein